MSFNVALELERRDYCYYEGDHGQPGSIFHPNGTVMCTASTPLAGVMLRLVIDQYRGGET